MYVRRKDNKTYLYIREGKPYVSTVSLKETSVITVYLPDGTLLTNASIILNGTTCMTDTNGSVSLTGEKDKPVKFQILYNENFTGEVETKFGVDANVSLIEMYLLTVTATGFRGSGDATVTTTIGSTKYTGSQLLYVKKGTSVTINITCGYYYYGSYVKVDGASTDKASYTFTMDKAHTITFTNGTYYDPNSGGT